MTQLVLRRTSVPLIGVVVAVAVGAALPLVGARAGTKSELAFALALVGATAFVVVPTRTFRLVQLAVLLLPMTTVRTLGAVGNVSDTVFLCAALAAIPSMARLGVFSWWRQARLISPLALFTFGGLASAFAAVSARGSFEVMGKVVFALWLLPIVLAVSCGSVERLVQLVRTFVLAAVATSTVALSDMLLHTTWGLKVTGIPSVWGRYDGLNGHPNDLGAFAALGIAAAVGLFVTKQLSVLLTVTALVFCLGGVAASGSLTALAAGGLGVLVSLFLGGRLSRGRSAVRPTVTLALLVLVIVGLAQVTTGQIGHRLSGDPLATQTVQSRLAGYSYAVHRIVRDPIAGVGLDQVSTGPTHPIGAPNIHNLWLQVTYTGGVLALLGFVFYYFRVLRTLVQVPASLKAPLAGMLAASFVASNVQPDVYSRFGSFGAIAILAGALLASGAAQRRGVFLGSVNPTKQLKEFV